MKRGLILGLSAALAMPAASIAYGQDVAPDTSSIVRKNRAPVSDEVLEVTLPRAVEAVLDNGLKVLILEDHRLPIVSMELGISGAGGIYEPADVPGLATMTAQMLREGTATRSNQEILEQVARLGATLSSRSNFGSAQASVSASGLARNMDEWVEIMLDVLLHPSFPESELDRLREQARVGLRQQRSSPAFLADERFNAAVFGDHPAAIVTETEASLDAMSTETIARWHRDRYAPQNSILGIAGDVDADELIPQLNVWFAGWERTDLVEELPPDPPTPPETRIFLVDRPNSEQTTIYIGTLAIDRRHPDYVPFTVMNEVLGGGAAARLFINLREEKGYTYGAYSTFSALKYPGAWRAFGDVRTEVTEGAMNEFMNEIARIREEPVPEGELAETKRSIVAGFALSLEQPSSLLGYSTLREIYGFDADYWDVYPAQIMAVTSEDVQSSVVAWIGAEMEFALSQAVASGDTFEHRPSECGHCVQDFLADLDLRDLPGEAAGSESGADDALPPADLRFYPAALVVPCGHLPCHAAVAADLGNMAIPNGWIPRRLRSDHCVLWRRYNHIQGLPIPMSQHIPCGRSIIGAVRQEARDRGIELIQEPG